MGIASKLKRLGESTLPAPVYLAALQAARSIAPSDQRRFELKTMAKVGAADIVLGGPFKGMRYLASSYGSAYLPKLLGCYESEIADFIGGCANKSPDVVIDIGCAEGYYAVGIAYLVPGVTVHAFDTSKVAQRVTVQLSELNNVKDRVYAKGFCDTTTLEAELKKATNPLVICDCEGYEEIVIDSNLVPSLSRATLVIEVHGSHIHTKLTAALASTHCLQHVSQTGRPRPKAFLETISEEDWKRASDEGRGPDQDWLLATPI